MSSGAPARERLFQAHARQNGISLCDQYAPGVSSSYIPTLPSPSLNVCVIHIFVHRIDTDQLFQRRPFADINVLAVCAS